MEIAYTGDSELLDGFVMHDWLIICYVNSGKKVNKLGTLLLISHKDCFGATIIFVLGLILMGTHWWFRASGCIYSEIVY